MNCVIQAPMPYSIARLYMRCGDGILYRSRKIVPRAIRLLTRGGADMSHASMVVGDITMRLHRVLVAHMVGLGIQPAMLSRAHEKKHGQLFWMPCHNTAEQTEDILQMVDRWFDDGMKYDWNVTLMGVLRLMRSNDSRLNCSEKFWTAQTRAGRFDRRYDKKGREIFPSPSFVPLWADLPIIPILF